jgi:formate hydrogenlyase transcriptional activator
MSVGRASERAHTVFRTGKPLIVSREEIAADPRGSNPNMSLCLFPLIARERVLGVFGLASSRDNPFAEDDVVFLGQVARACFKNRFCLKAGTYV